MKQSILLKSFNEDYKSDDLTKFNASNDLTVQKDFNRSTAAKMGPLEIIKLEGANNKSYTNIQSTAANSIMAKDNESFIKFITANNGTTATLETLDCDILESILTENDLTYNRNILEIQSDDEKRYALIAEGVSRALIADSEILREQNVQAGRYAPSKAEFSNFINENDNSITRKVIGTIAEHLKPVDALGFVTSVKAGVDGILATRFSNGSITNESSFDGLSSFNIVNEGNEQAQQNAYESLYKMAVVMFSNLTPGFLQSSITKLLPTTNIPSKTVTVVYSNAFGRIGTRKSKLLTGINRLGEHGRIAKYFKDGADQHIEKVVTLTNGEGDFYINQSQEFKDTFIQDAFNNGKYEAVSPVSIKITTLSTTKAYKSTDKTTGAITYDSKAIDNGLMVSSGSVTSVQTADADTKEGDKIILSHSGVTPIVLVPPYYSTGERTGFVFDTQDGRYKMVTFKIDFNPLDTHFVLTEIPQGGTPGVKGTEYYIKDLTMTFVVEPTFNNRKEDKVITSYVTTESQSFTVSGYAETQIEMPIKIQENFAEATNGDNIIQKQRSINSGLLATIVEETGLEHIIEQTLLFDALYGHKNISTIEFDLSSIARVSPGDKTTDIDIPKKIRAMFEENMRKAVMKILNPFYGIKTKGIFVICHPMTIMALGLESLDKYNDYKLSADSQVYKMKVASTEVAFVTSTLIDAFTEEDTMLDNHVLYAHVIIGDLTSISTVYSKTYEISSLNGYLPRNAVPFVKNISEFDFVSRFPSSLQIIVKGLINTSNPNPNDLSVHAGGIAYKRIS